MKDGRELPLCRVLKKVLLHLPSARPQRKKTFQPLGKKDALAVRTQPVGTPLKQRLFRATHYAVFGQLQKPKVRRKPLLNAVAKKIPHPLLHKQLVEVQNEVAVLRRNAREQTRLPKGRHLARQRLKTRPYVRPAVKQPHPGIKIGYLKL